MHPSIRVVAVLLLIAASCSSPVDAYAQAPGKARVVVNWGAAGFNAATGGWGSNVSKTKQGLFVHGTATGEGSLAGVIPAFDLGDDTYLEFLVVAGPNNTAGRVKLVLRDADGTEIAWYVPLADLQPQVPKNVSLLLDKFDETPAEGTEAGFNRKAVVGWRIEGDGTTNLMQMLYMALRAGH